VLGFCLYSFYVLFSGVIDLNADEIMLIQSSVAAVVSEGNAHRWNSSSGHQPSSTIIAQQYSLVPRSPPTCRTYLETYAVIPGSSWGSLPTALQNEWTRWDCDAVLEEELSRDTEAVPPVNRSGSLSEWCHRMKKKFRVIPMKSWGQLPMSYVDAWRDRSCDLIVSEQRMGSKTLSSCPRAPSMLRRIDSTITQSKEAAKKTANTSQHPHHHPHPPHSPTRTCMIISL